MPRVCLQFVIVVFPDHPHLLFSKTLYGSYAEGVMILQVLLQLNGTLSSNCYQGYLVQLGTLSKLYI